MPKQGLKSTSLNDAEDSPLVDGNGGVGDENQFKGILAVTDSF